jgi:hypothetical protein
MKFQGSGNLSPLFTSEHTGDLRGKVETCGHSLLIAAHCLEVNKAAPTLINHAVNDLLVNGRENRANFVAINPGL